MISIVVAVIISLAPLLSLASTKGGEVKSAAPSKEEKRIVQLLKEELQRYFKLYQEKMKDKAPYYLEAHLLVGGFREATGSFGTLYEDTDRRLVRLMLDARIGSYESDSSSFDRRVPYMAEGLVSLDLETASLRRDIWQLMDRAYKSSLESLYARQRDEVKRPALEARASSFSKETPVVYYDAVRAVDFERAKWVKRLRELTQIFRTIPQIYDDKFFLNHSVVRRYFVNTEGFEVVTRGELFNVILTAQVQSSDGTLQENYATFNSNRADRVPKEVELEKQRDFMIKEVRELINAPVEQPRTAPAIFSPEATAVLFHEAIGHRLEGERQESENSGQTFRDRVGQRIVPEMFTVIDNPTLAEFNGVPLIGSYTHDDQGISSRSVTLVEDGVLKGFLLSRKPVLTFTHSNGHGRAQAGFRPMARMGVLHIKARGGVNPKKLEEEAIKLARKQKKPYAYYIEKLEGGETNTTRFGFQALLSKLKIAYRIDAKTGKREMIRGVEIVGTPLTLVSRIIRAGDDYGVLNGYCAAESGTIPVSHIAPSILLSEVEFQRQIDQKSTPPVVEHPGEFLP